MNATEIQSYPGYKAANPSHTQASGRLQIHTGAKVAAAIAKAVKSIRGSTIDAVIAGQMLIEMMVETLGVRSVKHNVSACCRNISIDYQPDTTIAQWVQANSPGISVRTAGRWMEAANRVVRIITKSEFSEPVVWVEFGGQKVYVSTVLTSIDSECSDEMLILKNDFHHFVDDKSLYELIKCALNGCDAAHNIERAANGKSAGGARGENRRDYAKFVASHFAAINDIQEKWSAFIEKFPGQHAAMVEAMRLTILGGTKKTSIHGRIIDVKPWNLKFAKVINDITRERVKTVKTQEE